MHLMPRLEYEPKFGAIMGRLFFVTSLTASIPKISEVYKALEV